MHDLTLLPCDMTSYGSAYYPVLSRPLIIDDNGLPSDMRSSLYVTLRQTKDNPSGIYDVDGQQKVDSYHRSSTSCILDGATYEQVAARIKYVLDWQVAQEPNLIGKTFELAESLQFLRYEASLSGMFRMHTDNAYISATGKFEYTSPHRVLSTLTYVNDDYEGGELVFGNLYQDGSPLVLKPKAGQTIIFPADLRYPHEVRPVTAGQRYSIVGWYKVA